MKRRPQDDAMKRLPLIALALCLALSLGAAQADV